MSDFDKNAPSPKNDKRGCLLTPFGSQNLDGSNSAL